jgi:hypothetical protein
MTKTAIESPSRARHTTHPAQAGRRLPDIYSTIPAGEAIVDGPQAIVKDFRTPSGARLFEQRLETVEGGRCADRDEDVAGEQCDLGRGLRLELGSPA